MRKDNEMEIALTLAAIVAVVALLMWHSGVAAAQPFVPPQPPQPPPFDPSAWDPAGDVGNGVPGDYSFPINETDLSPIYNIPALSPVSLAPINLSNGTPQCGCTPSQIADLGAFLTGQNAILAAMDNAIANVPNLLPVVPVNISIRNIEPPAPPSDVVTDFGTWETVNGVRKLVPNAKGLQTFLDPLGLYSGSPSVPV